MKHTTKSFALLLFLCVTAGLVRGQKPELVVQTGHSNAVNCLAFDPDGKLLASGGDDKTVKIWDVASGRELRSITFATEIERIEFGETAACLFVNDLPCVDTSSGKQSAAIARRPADGSAREKGRLSATESWGDKTITVRDRSTGENVGTFVMGDAVSASAFSRDETLLAGGSSGGMIKVWSVRDKKEVRTLIPRTDSVTALAFSPDGQLLATGSGLYQGFGETDSIKVWDLSLGALTRTLSGDFRDVYNLAFSQDNKLLASVSLDSLDLWDLGNAGRLHSLTDRSGTSVPFDYSAGRSNRRAPSNLNTANDQFVFNRKTGELLEGRDAAGDGSLTFWDSASGRRKRELTLEGHGVLAINREGNLCVAIKNGGDGTTPSVSILATATGKPVVPLNLRNTFASKEEITSAAFSPDSTRVLLGGKGTIGLWSRANGRMLREFEGDAPAAVSPDNRHVVVSQGDTIFVYDALTGVKRHSLDGHSNRVTTLTFSPDGKLLLSGSLDTTAKLWDFRRGAELASLIAVDENDWLVVTPDGLFDGSPAAWDTMIWRARQNTFDYLPVEAYFSDFYHPGLLADVLAGKRPRAAVNIEDKDRRQPRVEILSAESATPSGEDREERESARSYLRIKVEVTEAPATAERRAGSGARDVRLFRDGTLVKLWRGDVLRGKGRVTLDAEVPVAPGKIVFTAYAFNSDNVKSRDARHLAEVAPRATGQPQRTAYLLAVGVNTYANDAYDLKYAVADARDFGAEWERQQAQLKQYQRVVVVPLFDREATKANILLALRRLIDLKTEPLPAGAPEQLGRLRYAEPQDAVVIFFAGHGTAEGKHFYLIPHDMGYSGRRADLNAAGLRQMLEHSVSDEELERAFEELQSGQTLLVIDACNSGQALEAEEKRRGPMNSKGLAQLAYEKGMYVLTASQSFQVANEEPVLGHGYLTYALVSEGLRSSAADREPQDGTVLLREWFRYAEERVPRLHKEQMGKKSDAELAQLRSRKVRELKLSGVEDVQRPRVFYRREPETQPLVVARPGAAQPLK